MTIREVFKEREAILVVGILIKNSKKVMMKMTKRGQIQRKLQTNKLASLEATLVRNSAHPLTHLLTHRGKV